MKPFRAHGTAQANEHGLQLPLEGGASLSIEILEPAMARVRIRPADGYREPRTWAVAPQPGADVPWSGRARDDLSGFSRSPASVQRRADGITLRTGAMAVHLQSNPLTLSWRDASGRLLVQDRASAAYMASPAPAPCATTCNATAANATTAWVTRPARWTCRAGACARWRWTRWATTRRTATRLYKHWPFVLTRAPGGGWSGIYYDTLAPAPSTWAANTTTTTTCSVMSRSTTATWTTT
jgi:alpha-glucosidase